MPGDEPPIPAADVAVVMVPMVAQGHLTQLFHLSTLISSYNIPVHYVSTTNCIRQLLSRHPTPPPTDIHFHHIPVPPFTTPPPNPNTPFPTHLQPSFDSTLHFRHPTAALIRSISQTAQYVVVIHDAVMSYVVQDVKEIINAETYLFEPLSAFYASSGHWEKTGGEFPVGLEQMRNLPSTDGISSPEFVKFVELQKRHMNIHVGVLYDSSRVIEGKFIEYLEKKDGKKKIWAVGPLNPVKLASDVTDTTSRHKCLQWLDKQVANSVIYVSFGTTTTFSDEQIRELALGLERSGFKFIWVVRVADTDGSEGGRVELPDGFEERVMGSGCGWIERGWAPQLEILGHFATGGFMSHCGWNSCMESVSMGVPMATWPMHSDQPRNAFLITNVLETGVAVKDWERRNELVTDDVVAEVVKRLMGSEDGAEMRQRAVELGGEVRESVAEGGVSRKDMNSFISYVRNYKRNININL